MSFNIFVLGFVSLCLAVAWVVPRRSKVALHRVGRDPGILGLHLYAARREFEEKGHNLVDDGYHKFKDDGFIIQTQDMERVVIPPKYLAELRMLPETKLSHAAALVEKHLGYCSGVDTILQSRLHSDVCRVQLTQHLPVFVPDMAAELSFAMSGFLTDCTAQEYTPIPTYVYVYSMSLAVSSRIFVGLPLAHDKAWLDTISAYLIEVVATANALRPYPCLLRPLLRPFLAPKSRMNDILSKAQAVLGPAILEKQNAKHKANDLLGFLILGSEVVEPIAIILKLLSATLHTSTMAAVHTLYDLCERPECIPELRAETKLALQEDDGSWQFTTTKKLRKLDSFIKESMRYNQPDALAFNRIVLSPVKLSNGLGLPVGTFINMAAESMSRDPAFYDNPNIFNGDRFFKPSESTKGVNPLEEFTGIVEPGNLAWGSGRLTCPGRWYANAMNKLIIGNLLEGYDMKFPDGVTRPDNLYSNAGIMPNPTQEILLKKLVN